MVINTNLKRIIKELFTREREPWAGDNKASQPMAEVTDLGVNLETTV